jgi:hypothetical protein
MGRFTICHNYSDNATVGATIGTALSSVGGHE